MATNTVGIDKEVEVNRKENLRDHRLYWIGRRTQDVILSCFQSGAHWPQR